MEISSIIDILKSNNSAKFKEETLLKFKEHPAFSNFLNYVYNPFIKYNIKQIPDYTSNGKNCKIEEVLPVLQKFIDKEVSGNNAKDLLCETLSSLNPTDAYLFESIINRTVDAGFSVKTINKVWKNLIPTIPYMRCDKLTTKTAKNITYPALVQLKADGTFMNTIKHKKESYNMTRNGTLFYITKVNEYLDRVLTHIDNINIIGEAIVVRDGRPLERKEGNGLINSYMSRDETRASYLEKQRALVNSGKINSGAFKKSVEDLKKLEDTWLQTERDLVLQVWDIVEYDKWVLGLDKTPYKDRLEILKDIVKDCPFMEVIETLEVNSLAEAENFGRQKMLDGFEGAVLKSYNMIWEDKTSKYQLKIKAELDADLRVIGYTPGEGVFEQGIGALTCVTSDNLLEVSVGSGFKRDERGLVRVDENDATLGLKLRDDITDIDSFYIEMYHDKIVTIKYNEAIKSAGKQLYSLFLPVFIEVRNDKDEADTLKKLLS